MDIYDVLMKPLEKSGLQQMRKRLLKHAEGVVLELGVGTGVNLPFYPMGQIQKLILTDIEKRGIVYDKMTQKMQDLHMNEKVVYREADAQRIPLENGSVDTVVTTLVFCTVPDVVLELNEIRRVLRPNGRLIFMEHVISPRSDLASIMTALTPIWKRMTNGCHLNRDFYQTLLDSGFRVEPFYHLFRSIFISGVAKP